MNVIETRNYGNTTVRFCDDSCKDMGEKEVKEILKSISDRILPYLQTKTA